VEPYEVREREKERKNEKKGGMDVEKEIEEKKDLETNGKSEKEIEREEEKENGVKRQRRITAGNWKRSWRDKEEETPKVIPEKKMKK
jgi:hypothetical protein